MKKVIYVGVVIAVVIVIVGLSVELKSEKPEKSVAYHVTLADPNLYTDGIFTDNFKIQKGTYQFNFVPNGDSPQTLSIALEGATFSFAEDFQLQGTPHETGISTYYTWDYLGKKEILVLEDLQIGRASCRERVYVLV